MKYILFPFIFLFVLFKTLFSKKDKLDQDTIHFSESILAVKTTNNKKEYIK